MAIPSVGGMAVQLITLHRAVYLLRGAGAESRTGDVPYDGPNGAGKNRFTCEMTPLPGFKVPDNKVPSR